MRRLRTARRDACASSDEAATGFSLFPLALVQQQAERKVQQLIGW